MARSRPPSFDFFHEDFIAGTMHLHPTAIGIYIRLLCFQWSHGAIPGDTRQLVQITGAMPDELEEHLPQVLEKFDQGDDGLYRNARLERERDRKTQFASKQRENGQKGGRPRKAESDIASESEMTPEKTQNNPWVSSGLSKEEPKQKPPIGSRKMEEGDTTKEKTNAADFGSDWDIPERLDTPQIRELLAEFEAMRIRKRKPIRDRKGSSKVLKHFDDQEHLIYALETCIANEYQGLKPDYRKPDRAKPAGPITFEQQRILNTQRAIEDFANG